jgi:GMC oxidoreductase
MIFWKSNPSLDTPDMACPMGEGLMVSPETAKFNPPENSWSFAPGIVRPKSRGHIRLTGASPLDPVELTANHLRDPNDLKAMVRCVEFCREIANSAALRPFVKREVIPGGMKGKSLENFIRDSVVTYWHQTCTAKMGRDSMSVVDGKLKVYGIDNLRIADGSIMPRINERQHYGPLRCHWGTRRRNAEGCSWSMSGRDRPPETGCLCARSVARWHPERGPDSRWRFCDTLLEKLAVLPGVTRKGIKGELMGYAD